MDRTEPLFDLDDHKEVNATTRKAIDAALAEGGRLPDGVVVDYSTGTTRYLELKGGAAAKGSDKAADKAADRPAGAS